MAETNEPTEKKSKKVEVCGHRNAHYIPAKGVKQATLTCTLPKDHEGDHSAPYQTLYLGEIVERVAFWSDAAGE